jgi:DNA polymerase elongation subunit (family B)
MQTNKNMDYEIDEIESVEYINSDYQDVYDIGMYDSPHTFFANDILVHNSCYLAAGRILKSIGYDDSNIQKTVDFLNNKISPLITKIIDTRMQHLANVMNCPTNKIFFKREMIARRGIHLAKKRYVAWVLDMEGKPIPEGDDHELEVKGVEIVRSSTPEIVRNYLKAVVLTLIKTLDSNTILNLIKNIHTEFMASDPVAVAKNSTANNLKKYIDPLGKPLKGCPQHIKGAILYNKTLHDMGLTNKYEQIYEGDKIKVVYITPQDHFQNNCISFKDKIPEEFNLLSCIDYDIMWDKSFIKPLKEFYNILKWDLPNCNIEDIEDLFY